jgi:hypothetical protein
MAEIVLVHGIDQQQKSADLLEAEWLPALAGGVRLGGYPDVADRIWQDRSKPGAISARMAFYGHLFLAPNQQGDAPGDLNSEELPFGERLALEWLSNAAKRSGDQNTRRIAERELSFVTNSMGIEQGTGQLLRTAVASLGKVSWFAPYGMGFAERFINRSLSQVTRYSTDFSIRFAALDAVASLIGPETKILIGHSLGSVVAYEVAHDLTQPLPLLVTLGSPLGLQSIIYQKLKRQPPGYPTLVRHWLNLADRNDYIAAEPNLEGMFGSGKPAGATFEGEYLVDNGAEAHRSAFYLGKGRLGTAVGKVFAEASQV